MKHCYIKARTHSADICSGKQCSEQKMTQLLFTTTKSVVLLTIFIPLCYAFADFESSPTNSARPFIYQYSYLSCDSYLRPFFPAYFAHCNCRYTAFSDWAFSTYRRVPTYQCTSGYVVVETRSRQVIAGVCHDDVEERNAECKISF